MALSAGLLAAIPCRSVRAGQAGIALARSPQGTLYSVWEEGEGKDRGVYLSRKSASGELIGVPVKVNDRPKGVGTALGRGPRLAVNGRNQVAVLWADDGGKDPKVSLPFRVSFSSDGGKTFRASVPLPTRKGLGMQDLGDVALGADGTVSAVWLQNAEGQGVHFWYARSASGQPFSPPQILDRIVCECCQTAVSTGPDGKTVVAAWRDNEKNIRDIKVRVSRDRGKTFGPVMPARSDRWKIDGCPMQGPSLTVGPKGQVAVAWSEGSAGPPIVHVATLQGNGFQPVEKIGAAAPATHPAVRYDDRGTLWVAWEEGLRAIWEDPPSTARIRFTSITDGGVIAPVQTAAAGPVRFPALAAAGAGTPVIGWVEGSGQRGENATVRVTSLAMPGSPQKVGRR
jgi:hypothetical protein